MNATNADVDLPVMCSVYFSSKALDLTQMEYIKGLDSISDNGFTFVTLP